FNPPYFRGAPRDTLERAFFATDVVERFAAGLRDHLAQGGQCLVLLASSGDEPGLLRAFESHALAVSIAARRDMRAEVVTLLRVAAPSRAGYLASRWRRRSESHGGRASCSSTPAPPPGIRAPCRTRAWPLPLPSWPRATPSRSSTSLRPAASKSAL